MKQIKGLIRNSLSRIRIFRLRRRGYLIGRNTYIGPRVRIQAEIAVIGRDAFIGNDTSIFVENLTLGDGTRVKGNTRVEQLKELRVGEYCTIHKNFHAAGQKKVLIGDNAWVGKNVRVDAVETVEIGTGVCLAEECMIWTHGHWAEQLEGYPVKTGPVKIGNDSWLAPRSIVLPGVTLGPHTIVQPGSVVTKDLDGHAMYGGQPAMLIRQEHAYRKPLEPMEKARLFHKYLLDKLASAGYTNTLKGRICLVRGRRHFHWLTTYDQLTSEDIQEIAASLRQEKQSEGLIVSATAVPDQIKQVLAALTIKICVFDLETKTYRKIDSHVEQLIKQLTYDRFARFTKEVY